MGTGFRRQIPLVFTPYRYVHEVTQYLHYYGTSCQNNWSGMIQNVWKTPQCTDMESPKGDVSSMSQTTQIKLKPKDCVFLVNSLGYIQFTPQLFSTVSSTTSLGRLPRPTVIDANCHRNKYKENNPKVSSISLPG